jgi:hypothetical protein
MLPRDSAISHEVYKEMVAVKAWATPTSTTTRKDRAFLSLSNTIAWRFMSKISHRRPPTQFEVDLYALVAIFQNGPSLTTKYKELCGTLGVKPVASGRILKIKRLLKQRAQEFNVTMGQDAEKTRKADVRHVLLDALNEPIELGERATLADYLEVAMSRMRAIMSVNGWDLAGMPKEHTLQMYMEVLRRHILEGGLESRVHFRPSELRLEYVRDRASKAGSFSLYDAILASVVRKNGKVRSVNGNFVYPLWRYGNEVLSRPLPSDEGWKATLSPVAEFRKYKRRRVLDRTAEDETAAAFRKAEETLLRIARHAEGNFSSDDEEEDIGLTEEDKAENEKLVDEELTEDVLKQMMARLAWNGETKVQEPEEADPETRARVAAECREEYDDMKRVEEERRQSRMREYEYEMRGPITDEKIAALDAKIKRRKAERKRVEQFRLDEAERRRKRNAELAKSKGALHSNARGERAKGTRKRKR